MEMSRLVLFTIAIFIAGCTDGDKVYPYAVNCSGHGGFIKTAAMLDGSGVYWVFCEDGYVYWSYGYSY